MRCIKPDLQKRLESHLAQNQALDERSRLLVAVSGGVDSMALAWLMISAGYTIGLAHCNFQLRGTESDGDQKLIESFSQQLGVQLFVKKFDTKEYAAKHKLSKQVAARELRYKWFEEIRIQYNYQYIATAHHKDDHIETFFINLFRGSGLQGLKGIPTKTGTLIRPLLFARRQEIELFAKEIGLPYRTDSSNESDDYLRNKIRHHLTPVVENISPTASSGIVRSMGFVDEAFRALEGVLMAYKSSFCSQSEGMVTIDLAQIVKLEEPAFWLYGIISDYGFSHANAAYLVKNTHNSGKIFLAANNKLVVERGFIQISPNKRPEFGEYTIAEIPSQRQEPLKMSFSFLSEFNPTHLPKTKHHIWLDADLISLPLTLRNRKTGDAFYPFGMKGRQKLSDYFVHQKFTLEQKEKCWLLCSGQDIVWVVEHRIDNRFKFSERTKTVLEIKVGIDP